MSINLTVNDVTYAYPEDGDPKGWGEEATGWAEEVTKLLSDLQGGNDIVETPFSIPSVQASATDVTGLLFDTGTVRSASINYNVYRKSDSDEVVESGLMEINYKTVAATWGISVEHVGDAKMTFSITAAGQVQYTADTISGLYDNSLSIMKFRAKTLSQTT